MNVTKLVAALAVLSVTAGSAMANPVANPAVGLSLSGDASGGGKTGHAKTTTVVLAGLAVAAVVGGAIALGTGHHGTPASS